MHPAAIGRFQIQRELGRGGMGVVYLAIDTKLDRKVAIKALPIDLSADPERLARLQREAKVLASLNHSNVGGIHGLETADGQQYLVLEFIEGETLADRLVSGPISVTEALTLARQIAEALEAAHEKGIVHRDLKPGNVMVTPEGVVKVLDFGLARTAEGAPSSTNVPPRSDSATIPSPIRHSPTIPGMIMGTAGYMSPEQARGKPVDKRSDIFSFGCVLFEMLAGVGPFVGESVTDSLGAILHREPNWSLLPAQTPHRVRELLTDCLAKDRRNRLHDIADARLELERAISGAPWNPTAAPVIADKRNWIARSGVVIIAVLLAGAAGWLLASKFASVAPQTPHQTFRLVASTPAKPLLRAVAGISPDAKFVIDTASTDSQSDSAKPQGVVVVRRLDRDETKVIEGTEGATEAALSPDGRWIAFAAARDRTNSRFSLKKLALENGQPSGAPERLCELPPGGSPSICWASGREIIMALPWNETILAVSSAGGEPRVVLNGDRTKDLDSWGEISPGVDERTIFATRWSLVGQGIKERTEIVDLISGKRTPLLQSAGGALYLPGGYLVARRNLNSLIAARFDPTTLQVIGEPVTIFSGGAINRFMVSNSGTLALTTASGDIAGRKLARVDEQGQIQNIAAPARAYGQMLSVSPDGGRIAMNLDPTDPNELPTDLWIFDLTRRTFSRVPTQGPSWMCAWSSDGQRIAYCTVGTNGFSVWERRADGQGEPVLMYASDAPQIMVFPTAWSPDGKVLAIQRVDLSKQSSEAWMLEKEAGSTKWVAKPYLGSPANVDSLAFFPDGKWVRFASDEAGGHSDLYFQRFTGAGAGAEDAKAGRVQVPTGGNGSGWLSADGKELRYLDPDDQMMSVQVQTEPTLSTSLPKLLYSVKNLKTKARTIAPDGQLVVVLEGENERTTMIDVVVNFLDEVRTKLPAPK